MTLERPSIFVIGGPNGAGKTTSALSLLPGELKLARFVNADLIAKGLSPLDPDAAAIQAGRLMLDWIHELADRRESFAFQTTLASKSFAPFLGKQQARGFFVHLIYVWLESADLAIARVRQRALRGGHSVPEDVIRRRYSRGLTNFVQLYSPVADSWTLCDNSGGTTRDRRERRQGSLLEGSRSGDLCLDRTMRGAKAAKEPTVETMTTDEILVRIERGMGRAIAKEVAMLRREGLPIIVSQNGKIVDLNSPARRRARAAKRRAQKAAPRRRRARRKA